MRQAMVEARKGLGLTSPNPMVGAVLVRAGRVVARGHHRRAGAPHAEIECLDSYGESISPDLILYVTLEPCSTTGRTPPCSEALIARGIRNVVIGAEDPNPAHSGRGIAFLRAAGIRVKAGVLEAECSGMNRAFNHWIRTKNPWVIAKCAMTLDGRLTRPPGEDRWITSPAARRHANRFRATVDAILVGAETARADDPRLTVRARSVTRQPWRVILTRSGRLPASLNLLADRLADRTLVFRNQPLADVLRSLGEKEITSVMIEGGGDVLGQALDQRLVHEVHLYFAPWISGGQTLAFAGEGAGCTKEALRLGAPEFETIGPDLLLRAQVIQSQGSSE